MLPASLGSRHYSLKEQWSSEAETGVSLSCSLPNGVEQLGLPRHSEIVSGKCFEFYAEICFINTIIIEAIIKAEPWFQLMCLWRQWVGSHPLYCPARGTQHPPYFPPCSVSQFYCFQFPSFLKELTLLLLREGQSPEKRTVRQELSEEQIKVAISVKIAGFSP